MTTTSQKSGPVSGALDSENLQSVSIEKLVEIVAEGGSLIVDSQKVADELLNRGFVVNDHCHDGTLVLHRRADAPEGNDLERMQSLIVDAYSPYSPKSPTAHPSSKDLPRHARISAPQQIIMQSPSEHEFMRTAEDLITHEKRMQEVYADVRFRAAYTRLVDSPYIGLHLMIEEVQFGVTECFNNRNTRGHFIYCIEIKAFPSEKWAHMCKQRKAKPDQTYDLQRHNTLGVTERLSKLSLPELPHVPEHMEEANYESSTTPQSTVKHKWLPAVCNPQGTSKSVEWAWSMTAWDDGQTFHCESPTSCTGKAFPELPFKNPEVVRFKDLEDVNEATWEVSTDAVKNLNGRLDWSFEIKIYTTCLQQVELRVGKEKAIYRNNGQRVAAKFKGKTSRSNALIIPPDS